MSRLDSFIRRLQAQRACLDHAVALVRDLPGVVLELGLGNGRTYDHLREGLPGRDVYAFDRQVAAHPDCIPAEPFMIVGDIDRTLPRAQFRGPVALAHVDLGSGDKAASERQAAALAPLIADRLQPGAVVVGDQPLPDPRLRAVDLPPEVKPGRYYIYRLAVSSEQ